MYVCTVGMCTCSYVCAHVCPPFVRQHLTLNMELTDCAKLAGQQGPGIFLLQSPQHCDYRCVL